LPYYIFDLERSKFKAKVAEMTKNAKIVFLAATSLYFADLLQGQTTRYSNFEEGAGACS